MAFNKSEDYRRYVQERMGRIIPVLEEAAMGNLSSMLEIPEQEDEFTELLVSLNLMLDDLRELARTKAEYAEKLEKINDDLDRKVKERTKELEERMKQGEKLMNVLVGRELKMVELKKEISRLKQKCGEAE